MRRRRRSGLGRAAPYAARRLRPTPDRRPTTDAWCAADREEISRGIAEGVDGVVIAARIGRDPSVVSRDIARHGGRQRYRATRAARVAARARCRPKARKLDTDPVLRAQVIARLRAGYSPDQVAGRLRHEHGGEHAERVADTVSHEAIYTWIYALPKGELAQAGDPAALGAHPPSSPRTQLQPGCPDRGYDQHRRPAGRGRRPGRARELGGRPCDAKVAREEWLHRLEAQFDEGVTRSSVRKGRPRPGVRHG